MCGIAGIAGRSDPALVGKMCYALSHRGPDDQGIFSDQGISLGMRRLAIIDCQGGHQPIHNEDKSVWIVFNGEIYNYKKIRSGLVRRGHTFTTSSDTEVIVHLYEEYGEECLGHLRGMFAFAIWDRSKETLFLARDRLGIKPLIYTFDGENIVFASEIRALLDAGISQDGFDPEALNYFLTYLYVPSPRSMFRSIRKLPPAHTLTYCRGKVRIRRYWDLHMQEDRARPEERDEGDYREEAASMLRESVRMHLVSDVPLGAFLSGGMDSACVVALMSEYSSGPVKTFTIGYGEEDASFNELDSARIVADAFGTDHHEFILQPDVVSLLPDIIRAIGEPFADSSAIPTYLISRETRKHVTVALSGIGGDEVFAGYPRYLGARLSGIYDVIPGYIRRYLFAPLADRLPESTRSRNVTGWIKRFARGGLLDPVSRYLSWITFFSPEMKEGLYSDDFKSLLRNHNETDIHRHFFDQEGKLDYVQSVTSLDLNTYLPDDLLLMGDAMSMAHSLELRVPFCDHKLIEFMLMVPTGMKMKGWHLKGMLRSMMKGLLPPEILMKKKQGFMVPIGVWFKRDLQGFVRDTLLSGQAMGRGVFNPSFVERMVRDHFEGKQVYTHQIWALLTFEIWCRIYMDREGCPDKETVVSQAR
ncbi:MAG: asparagine synthase (glutamine-hydrolyzing) [bacterium]